MPFVVCMHVICDTALHRQGRAHWWEHMLAYYMAMLLSYILHIYVILCVICHTALHRQGRAHWWEHTPACYMATLLSYILHIYIYIYIYIYIIYVVHPTYIIYTLLYYTQSVTQLCTGRAEPAALGKLMDPLRNECLLHALAFKVGNRSTTPVDGLRYVDLTNLYRAIRPVHNLN